MNRLEKICMALLILYSAYYADAAGWIKDVCYVCMFVFFFVFIFAGGWKQ